MEAYTELSRVRLPWATRNQVIYSRILHHVEDILSHQASQNIAKRLFLLQELYAAVVGRPGPANTLILPKQPKSRTGDGDISVPSDLGFDIGASTFHRP